MTLQASARAKFMGGATGELRRMRRTMREVFGLGRLRPGQAEVIRSVLEGHDTLAVMPTGAGDREKLERVMLYGQSADCRWKPLHEYFGEEFEAGPCGHCDNCLHPLEEQLGLAPAAESAPAPTTKEPPAAAVVAKRRKAVELSEGDAVRVPKHGRGRVATLEDDKVSVEFPGGETRTFKRGFVRRA